VKNRQRHTAIQGCTKFRAFRQRDNLRPVDCVTVEICRSQKDVTQTDNSGQHFTGL
jgi:hypothetical protein